MKQYLADVYPYNGQYTYTAGIGDSIQLRVGGSFSKSNLRWRHNGGGEISKWNGNDRLYIELIRKADDGIYECYENGKDNEGKHAIFRLIVRGKQIQGHH